MVANSLPTRWANKGQDDMIYDFLVIGGGISGASAAYELADLGSVLVLEAESSCGYHSTGRSAALFTRNYGGPVVRRINAASAYFFVAPPDGFCEGPLLTPRGALTVATEDAVGQLDAIVALSEPGHEVSRMSPAEAVSCAPYLRPGRVAAAIYEPGSPISTLPVYTTAISRASRGAAELSPHIRLSPASCAKTASGTCKHRSRPTGQGS